jgi:hypothetical protein
MRSFLISLLLLSTVNSFSQSKDKYRGGGSIHFDEPIYVFGDVEEDKGPVSTVFHFINTGKGPMRITNVLTSCGCTTPQWSEEAIEPGGRGFVKGTFDPKNRPGHFSRTLTVITNGVPDQVVLTLEGTVVSANSQMNALFPVEIGNLRFNKKELAFVIKENKTDTLWLGILNPSKKKVIIRNIISPLPIRTEAKNIYLLPEQGENIMMTYNASLIKELGEKEHEIILLTSDDSIPAKTIKIKASIVQDFDKLTPEQRQNAPIIAINQTEADLGELYQGETGSTTLEITNNGQSDLVIRKMYSKSGTVTGTIANPVVKKGKKAKITASLHSKGMHGKVEDDLLIIANDPKKPYTLVKLKARVVIPGMDPTSN